MEYITLIFFWLSIIFILYTYFLYPIIVMLLSLIMAKKINKKNIFPKVSVFIVVCNEEKLIKKKIECCLNLDYPKESIEIVVVSSGSTDRTDQIIASYETAGVKLIKFPENKGKSFAINQSVPGLNGEIIFFTDVRQELPSDCLKELVANFNDPCIGGVSGELMFSLESEAEVLQSVGVYWRYEKFLRVKESEFDSTLGTTGAIYAIRKNLFVPFPEDTILDDFVIPMHILKQGYRVVYERNAKAWDTLVDSYGKEFKRKARTIGGNYQAFFRMPYLFNCQSNRVIFQFISHKVFRLLLPYAFIVLFVANFFIDSKLYHLFFFAQIVGYILSFWGLFHKRGFLGFFGAFMILNSAAVAGLYKYATKTLDTAWK